MLPINYAGYKVGLETGKLSYVGYNGHGFCLNSFWCGQPLMELEPQIRAYRQKLFDFHQLTTANYCSLLWETTLFLLGNPENIQLAFTESVQEEKLISQSLAANDNYRVFAFYLYRAILRFLMGEIIGAAADVLQARNYIAGVLGAVIEAGLYFYDSLITLGKVSKLAVELPGQVAENQSKLQFWAEHAPMNYLHKWQLVEAERYRVLGQKLEAIEFYDQAIAGAKKHGFIQEEALANELAAKFYLNWGKETIAHAYMIEAHYCYLSWGATTKVKQLEAEYPQLCQSLKSESSLPMLSSNRTSQGDSSNSNNAVLDLTTIMKSSQAIASEMVLENLLQTLMKILLENAGAQSGCLLLPTVNTTSKQGKENNFYIAASSSVDTVTISPLQPLNGIFPESVVNYIVRTQESVVLNNAAIEGKFVRDSYIQLVKPLSVLCYPLLNQGRLVGIVYLENNLTVGAFSADQIELLQLISGQAAIAITNAQLYAENIEYTHTLEAKVAERTAELEQANEKLLRLATLDGLTKIPNRRRFDDYFTTEWQRHLRKQEPLALILMDIDYFKYYNDYYGHQGGDDCLVRVAQMIAQMARRSTDLVARYGGEEFAAILPNTHTQAALMLAESMRQAIASLAIPHAQSKVSNYVSLSLGVASLVPTPKITPEDLITRADQALYAAKNQGRNQVVSY
jgi:diguanylate cyclase (GGDEF)-like protein